MDPRIAVVGAGHMGRSALGIMLRQAPKARFLAVDRDPEAVAAACALDPSRVEGQTADVSAGSVDARGCDLLLNLAGPFFTGSDAAARIALDVGAVYVDVADDVEATNAVLALDETARAAGVPLVTGAGLSPGVSNWLAARLLAEQPSADGIQVVWVVHEPDPGGLAPLRHMLHMAVSPCPVWRDGRLQQSPGFVPETAVAYDLPAPLGRTEAFDTAHPEPLTLSRHFPRLRYAGCKGALMPAWANSAFSTLGRIGFGYHDVMVRVGDQLVEPAEYLWLLMWERYRRRERPAALATTMIHVIALRGEEPLAALTVWDDAPMSRGTGLGAAAAALTVLECGVAPGAWGAEVIPAEPALRLFTELAGAEGAFAAGLLHDLPARI